MIVDKMMLNLLKLKYLKYNEILQKFIYLGVKFYFIFNIFYMNLLNLISL